MRETIGKWEQIDPHHGHPVSMIKALVNYLNLSVERRENLDKYGQHWIEYRVKENKDGK